jgi:hypothetical protein
MSVMSGMTASNTRYMVVAVVSVVALDERQRENRALGNARYRSTKLQRPSGLAGKRAFWCPGRLKRASLHEE